MKITKSLLHYLIAAASLFSFLGGWILLAHSRKPIQPSQTTLVNAASLPPLPPIQAFGDTGGNGTGLSSFAPNLQSQPSFGFPALRTRGS